MNDLANPFSASLSIDIPSYQEDRYAHHNPIPVKSQAHKDNPTLFVTDPQTCCCWQVRRSTLTTQTSQSGSTPPSVSTNARQEGPSLCPRLQEYAKQDLVQNFEKIFLKKRLESPAVWILLAGHGIGHGILTFWQSIAAMETPSLVRQKCILFFCFKKNAKSQTTLFTRKSTSRRLKVSPPPHKIKYSCDGLSIITRI